MGEDTDALRREVAEARTELGATLQALGHKAAAPRRATRAAGRTARRLGSPAVGLALVGMAVVVMVAVRAARR